MLIIPCLWVDVMSVGLGNAERIGSVFLSYPSTSAFLGRPVWNDRKYGGLLRLSTLILAIFEGKLIDRLYSRKGFLSLGGPLPACPR
jgi:hypothetical protein